MNGLVSFFNLDDELLVLYEDFVVVFVVVVVDDESSDVGVIINVGCLYTWWWLTVDTSMDSEQFCKSFVMS